MRPTLLAGALGAGASLLLAAAGARAVPGSYPFVDDPRCDAHEITLTHELGNPPPVGPFPDEEAIDAGSTPLALPVTCPGSVNDGLLADFLITITNLTDLSWIDLFFVADAGITFDNADGTINGGDAMKIDTLGVNTPLVSESIAADLIFEPGESWTFIVIDWSLAGAFPTPFASIGVGVDSVTGSSWASIVANPVPEPGTVLLLSTAFAGLGWALRRRHRSVGAPRPVSSHGRRPV